MSDSDPAVPRVVVIDDHGVTRWWLRTVSATELEIVAEYGTAKEGIEGVVEEAPDVAVVDLALPGVSGIEAIGSITALQPTTRILVIAVSAEGSEVGECFRRGALGYLIKKREAESEVREAIRRVADGQPVIPASVAPQLLEYVRGRPISPERRTDAASLKLISPREREVLALVAAGRENAEIAADLGVSPSTVKNHVASILRSLHVANRAQAAAQAVRSGLL